MLIQQISDARPMDRGRFRGRFAFRILLRNFPWTARTHLSHHVRKPGMAPSNFVGDLTNFSSANFRFAHGTTPKTVQMQPAKLTAQTAEKTKTMTSIPMVMVSYTDATNQANCNAVKERPKNANPRISKPIMDASLKALFGCRQNRDTSSGTMCRKSQNCRLPCLNSG
jgi:hypothetical protein